jgi:3-oxoacyl-[acyl-carrier protein] reductase
VDGLVYVTRAVSDGMKLRGFGRIVNLTSVAAHGTALSGTTFYAATKAAVIALTRRFAMELGLHGITVNAVAPGFIPTDITTGGRSPAEAQATIDAMAARAMVRRTGLAVTIQYAGSQSVHFAAARLFILGTFVLIWTVEVLALTCGVVTNVPHVDT